MPNVTTCFKIIDLPPAAWYNCITRREAHIMKVRAYIRMIITALGSLFLGAVSVSLASNLFSAYVKAAHMMENSSPVIVDGEDFSALFRAGGFIFGNILGFIVYLVSIVGLIVLSVIFSLILRALLIKEKAVTPLELRFSAFAVIGAGLVSVIVSLIMSKGVGLALILIANALWLVFPILMYIVRLKDLKAAIPSEEIPSEQPA